MEDLDHVGEVVLAQGVLGAEPAQGGGQEAAAQAVDRRVDLADLTLLVGCIGVLDDAADPLVAVAEDAPVAGRVVDLGRQHRAGGVGDAVLADEGGEGGGAQQGRVARQHDDVAVLHVVTGQIVGEGGEGDRGGVARAPGHVLLDEVDDQLRGRLLLDGLRHPLGPVPDDDDGPLDRQFRQGVEHVQQHGPPAQHVQGLGPGRLHAGALPGSQHHGRERAITAHRAAFGGAPERRAVLIVSCAPPLRSGARSFPSSTPARS